MKGRVVKIISFEYYVADETNGEVLPCRVRGKLRKDGDIYVGDIVEYFSSGKYGNIEKVFPRKNYLTRPYVANIDMAVIVLSMIPKPDFLLADKILVNCIKNNIQPLLCINKSDLGDTSVIMDEYSKYYDVIRVSAVTGEGIEELKEKISGKLSCFAGQSAVGKTSIINNICSSDLETGTLSKILRGRHTTRHVEIFEIFEGAYVADTCGFSLLELEAKSVELAQYYLEFDVPRTACKFKNCVHINELQCGVKEAIAEGKIPEGRYERYLELYKELKSKEIY